NLPDCSVAPSLALRNARWRGRSELRVVPRSTRPVSPRPPPGREPVGLRVESPGLRLEPLPWRRLPLLRGPRTHRRQPVALRPRPTPATPCTPGARLVALRAREHIAVLRSRLIQVSRHESKVPVPVHHPHVAVIRVLAVQHELGPDHNRVRLLQIELPRDDRRDEWVLE